ncbi:TPA: N-6 DNA methylase [Staphylococcus aureus]
MATIGFEEKLWQAADKLRGSMDAAEYKNVALGIIFLKYVSDSFEEKYEELLNDEYADEEDKDEYLAENIFWVPKESRWQYINDNSKKPEIGQIIDKAMIAIERENESLKGVLPKDYARPALDKEKLGDIIDLFTFKVGDSESKKQDILGRVYEYFIAKFASAEGKNAGEFYTPASIVKLLVEMIEPYQGRIYDPCCGSGGMFVQSEHFIERHQGRIDDIAVYGQESNPPFNASDWGREKLQDDYRWKFGIPPKGNANYAWIEHMISKLAPSGTAGFVLANGSMSTSGKDELEIRKNLIEQDMVECIVTLPGQLFYSTQIPVCLWFMTKNKAKNGKNERRGEVLFIDARNIGSMVSRTLKEFSDDEIKDIANVYHSWRGTNNNQYEDKAGFCKVAKTEEIKNNEYILTPGRYVGLAEVEEDSEPFEQKMERITADLSEQFAKSKELEDQIRKSLEGLGYGV